MASENGEVVLAFPQSENTHLGRLFPLVVRPEHRGLLLKPANLLRLREREPGIGRIITWNTTSNAHMLAINEALGFRVLDEWNEWRLPVGPRR
ncbi:hypothetical protein ABT294_13005 [Nonomuraea sp. NPDC000554]|uniref:hypothetical protein n=1 Tax=Nonomuraea sp. NPDC000554 TaxID=3154259 RepID=UPI00331AA28F